jgi:hypothetical protein
MAVAGLLISVPCIRRYKEFLRSPQQSNLSARLLNQVAFSHALAGALGAFVPSTFEYSLPVARDRSFEAKHVAHVDFAALLASFCDLIWRRAKWLGVHAEKVSRDGQIAGGSQY